MCNQITEGLTGKVPWLVGGALVIVGAAIIGIGVHAGGHCWTYLGGAVGGVGIAALALKIGHYFFKRWQAENQLSNTISEGYDNHDGVSTMSMHRYRDNTSMSLPSYHAKINTQQQ
ncbi:MAG TPA: hypothetical protein VIH61_09570 [Waddliaceae bacterium]